MRVAYVTAQAPWGAGEAFVLPEVLQLLDRGCEVTVFPLRPDHWLARGREAAAVAEHGVALPLFDLRILGMAVRAALTRPIQTAWVIASLLCRSGSLAKVVKNLAVLPKGMALAQEFQARRIQHIHAHWASTPSTAAYIASRLTGLSWSLTAHRWDIGEANLIAEKGRTAAFLRTISERGCELLRAQLSPVDRPKVRVIHMGVALDPPSAAPRARNDVFTIAAVGHFIPVKGHRYLLEACARLMRMGYRFRCVFWGSGPLEGELRQRIVAEGLAECAMVEGVVPHDELLQRYSRAEVDAVVLPSIRTADGEEEGIPVSLMEAMAAGIPVVSTNTGAISELLGNGAGMLVPPQDPEGLATALAKLMDDRGFGNQVGDTGRRRVESEFSLDGVAGQLEALFRDAAGSESEPGSGG